ncbi:hypothetical protein E2C01_088353 [Portunus trituberculatus]|uniref:Uncharacterized protein n=1 Tax=Portunus trituberculatus TaxID=210409 RepID=A0A5B7J900_PORTR|nr:hypothetical protein [Portunus trituberculatus]
MIHERCGGEMIGGRDATQKCQNIVLVSAGRGGRGLPVYGGRVDGDSCGIGVGGRAWQEEPDGAHMLTGKSCHRKTRDESAR